MLEIETKKEFHGCLLYLLKYLNNDVVDAGYNDGVFWYKKIKRNGD